MYIHRIKHSTCLVLNCISVCDLAQSAELSWCVLQTGSDGGGVEGDLDPLSLPTADQEQDGFIMVDLTDIVS